MSIFNNGEKIYNIHIKSNPTFALLACQKIPENRGWCEHSN